jgi:hypothetical protein
LKARHGTTAGKFAPAQRHPVYKHAETLLNVTFRKEKVAQRAAVLKSAAWLISLLEQFPGIL